MSQQDPFNDTSLFFGVPGSAAPYAKDGQINALDKDGNTPLMRGAAGMRDEFLKEAFEAGADFSIANKAGQTIAHKQYEDPKSVAFLVSKGVRYDTPDNNGVRPVDRLHDAMKQDTNGYPQQFECDTIIKAANRKPVRPVEVKDVKQAEQDEKRTGVMEKVRAAARSFVEAQPASRPSRKDEKNDAR